MSEVRSCSIWGRVGAMVALFVTALLCRPAEAATTVSIEGRTVVIHVPIDVRGLRGITVKNAATGELMRLLISNGKSGGFGTRRFKDSATNAGSFASISNSSRSAMMGKAQRAITRCSSTLRNLTANGMRLARTTWYPTGISLLPIRAICAECSTRPIRKSFPMRSATRWVLATITSRKEATSPKPAGSPRERAAFSLSIRMAT